MSITVSSPSRTGPFTLVNHYHLTIYQSGSSVFVSAFVRERSGILPLVSTVLQHSAPITMQQCSAIRAALEGRWCSLVEEVENAVAKHA